MRLSIAGGLAALALASAACVTVTGKRVEKAWVRLPAVSGRPGAAYFTLSAQQRPLTLLSVRTAAAIRAELHESMAGSGGMMSMQPLRQIDVPAGGTVTLAPGGRHVMLFDVNPALKPGDTTALTLTFADGTTIEAPAKVRGAGEAAPN